MIKPNLAALAVLAFALPGCATVSVAPGSGAVETTVLNEQSALRDSAKEFQRVAVSRGWISESRGFFDLAKVLVDGGEPVSDDAQDYAAFIGVGERASDDVLATLSADLGDAAEALSTVSAEAQSFLEASIDASTTDIRADLVSYERALVQAQQSRRSFVEAASLAGVESESQLTGLVAQFDAAIDTARDIADLIAADYSSRDTGTSVS